MTETTPANEAPVSTPAAPRKKKKQQESARETVEAVTIAFILAFVFKTFEAEAFVIPTGSMAPTLYGRHKEVTCDGCSLMYTVGASQEIDQDSGALNGNRIRMSVCPNCRHVNNAEKAPVFNGDRIVVNKQVSRYKRFDVVVFKNPEEPHINYIKRLVGLPGETVRIRQGDLYARKSPEEPWKILRKDDLKKQKEIQLLVYDDRNPPRALLAAGAEERWAPAVRMANDTAMGGWPKAENSWKPDAENRSYAVSATGNELQWLRYRHLIPGYEHWQAAEKGESIAIPVQPQLIGDFCGFNSDHRIGDEHELYWVNDLTLEFELSLEEVSDDSELVLELEEGMRTVQCRIQPSTGSVKLVSLPREGGEEVIVADGTCGIQGTGGYSIAFCNVDDRLNLWVDEAPVELTQRAELSTPDLNLPTDHDLAPAGIAAKNLKAAVSDIRLRRDIYYRNDVLGFDPASVMTSNPMAAGYSWAYLATLITEVDQKRYNDLSTQMRTPASYAEKFREYTREQEVAFGSLLEFQLNDDEYLMFGDNSPASKDSRLFDFYSRPMRGVSGHRYAVKESDLIGEALCIFWPHGIPFMNGGRGYPVISHGGDKTYPLYSFPFYPNVSRMKLIR